MVGSSVDWLTVVPSIVALASCAASFRNGPPRGHCDHHQQHLHLRQPVAAHGGKQGGGHGMGLHVAARLALEVLLRTGPLAHEHQRGMWIPDAEDHLGAGLRERAPRAHERVITQRGQRSQHVVDGVQRAGPGAVLAEASLFAAGYHCDAVAAERSASAPTN